MKNIIVCLALFLLFPNYGFCQWFNQDSGTEYTLYSVDFLTDSDGWIAGRENIVKQSTDGGQSWELFSDYTYPPRENWRSISFVSLNDIYVCGERLNGDRYQSNWTFSTNSGSDWSSQRTWGFEYSGWKDVFFLDQNIGYKVGFTRWTSTHGKCYKTSGGVAGEWEELVLTAEDALRSVFFIDENNGWVVGNNGVIYISNDGGVNWEIQTSNTSKSLNSVYFIDAATGWIVGSNNTGAVILKTTNSGQTWSVISPTDVLSLNCIYFANSDVGWTCGSIVFEGEERGAILYTENGGESWEVQHIEDNLSILYDIDFIDENTGWVVGTDGILLKTTTGGVTDIIDERNSIIKDFALEQNYPNPFNPTTTIKYSVPERSNVTLKIFDVLGREVSTLVRKEQTQGNYRVEFDASELTSGIYFYQLNAHDFVETKKMVILR